MYWVPTIGYFVFGLDEVTNPGEHKYYEEIVSNARRNFAFARELGVKIANGFDPSSPKAHGQNAREILAMNKLGLTPLEAVRAATLTASELMGWQEEVGTIEPGKYADIIAVRGNPLSDLVQIQNVAFVMKDGVVVKNEISSPVLH